VSYALAIAGDARPDLRALDPWLQEEDLDELEILATDPSLLPAPPPGSDILYGLSRLSGGAKHYVAVTLSRNDMTQTLTVLGISHRELTLPPQP
jgi:hypothetical protein